MLDKESVECLKDQTTIMHELGEALRERVDKIEKFLANLPGRTGAMVDMGGGAIIVAVRVGKDWKLKYRSSSEVGLILVEACSFDVKVKVLSYVNQIVRAMTSVNYERIERAQDAIKAFDTMFGDLGSKEVT